MNFETDSIGLFIDPSRKKRAAGSLGTSLAAHVAAVALLGWASVGGEPSRPAQFIAKARVVRLVAPPPQVWETPKPTLPPAPPAARPPAPKQRPPAPPPPPQPRVQPRLPPAEKPSPRPERASLPRLAAPASPAARALEVDGIGSELAIHVEPAGLAVPGALLPLDRPPTVPRPKLPVRTGGFAGIARAVQDAPPEPPLLATMFGAVLSRSSAAGPRREAASGRPIAVGSVFGAAAAGPALGEPVRAAPVANAGFGAAEASAELALPVEATPKLSEGGFRRAVAERSPAAEKTLAPKPEEDSLPVRILSKPEPAYSEEARALRIEGEVVIKVLFRADGRIAVLGVVRGLGFGLDRNALEAARRIRFEPAQRLGRSIATKALVRILFQMAY